MGESLDQDHQKRAAGGDNEPKGRQERDDRAPNTADGRAEAGDDRDPSASDADLGDDQRGSRPRAREPDRAAIAGGDAAEASTEPDLSAADQSAESVDRFDQQAALPWQSLDPEQGLSDRPSLDGEASLGAGAALMEQRLQQVEGDPTRLMRNQFRLEEARRLRESSGQLREARPW